MVSMISVLNLVLRLRNGASTLKLATCGTEWVEIEKNCLIFECAYNFLKYLLGIA